MASRNYQKDLDKLIEDITAEGLRPRLLMHACCAPCSSYCMEYLAASFDITLFFYNPNIDCFPEYDKRASELERLVSEAGLKDRVNIVVADYDPESYMEAVRGHELDPERGERCRICYRLRLNKTAEYMRCHGGYDYFCTTLTLSPHKDAQSINEIGSGISGQYLATDFKKKGGYIRSIELSREYGLYRQDYCGCVFSRREREKSASVRT